MKSHVSLGIGFLIFGTTLLVGAFINIRDTNLRPQDMDTITGKVTEAGIVKTRRSGRSLSAIFYFNLDNSPETFSIHRSQESQYDLSTSIFRGDTLKVFYKKSYTRYNLNTFQIEKRGSIIKSYTSYQQDRTSISTVLFSIAALALITSIFYFSNSNIIQLLVRLAEGKKKL